MPESYVVYIKHVFIKVWNWYLEQGSTSPLIRNPKLRISSRISLSFQTPVCRRIGFRLGKIASYIFHMMEILELVYARFSTVGENKNFILFSSHNAYFKFNSFLFLNTFRFFSRMSQVIFFRQRTCRYE